MVFCQQIPKSGLLVRWLFVKRTSIGKIKLFLHSTYFFFKVRLDLNIEDSSPKFMSAWPEPGWLLVGWLLFVGSWLVWPRMCWPTHSGRGCTQLYCSGQPRPQAQPNMRQGGADHSNLRINPPAQVVYLLLDLWSLIESHLSTSQSHYNKADSSFAASHWEAALLCNNVSNWLGANLESALL